MNQGGHVLHFSSRIPDDWSPSPWSALASELRQAHAQEGVPLFDLTVSSPISVGIEWNPEVLRSALADAPSWLQWKPDSCGSRVAREAVCRYEQQRGAVCNPEEFILTASTSEAYSHLFKVLCDPGDSILVPRPGYPLLDVLCSFENLQCVGYTLRADQNWSLDWESLESAPAKARAVLVVDPNNPTGSMLSPQDWMRLAEFCRYRNMAIIVDQVFADFPLQPSPGVDWVKIAHKVPLFRLNGMSKSYGLPQAKLAWIWFGCPPQFRVDLQNALEYVADAYLNLSALPEALLPGLAGLQRDYRDQVLARVLQNLAVAREILAGVADSFPAPLGGWYACAHFADVDDEEFTMQLAREHGVLVHPGFFFDFVEDGWLVFSLLAEPQIFAQGISYLAQAAHSH